MKNPDKTIAVITGRVISATAKKLLIDTDTITNLNKTLTNIANSNKSNRFSIYRDNTFQITIHNYTKAIEFAILIRIQTKAYNHNFDCQISIAIAQGAQIRSTVGTSTGTPFTLSGQSFDKMRYENLSIKSSNHSYVKQFELLTKMIDSILNNLSHKQTVAILQKLLNEQNLSQIELAHKLKTTPAALSANLKRGQWHHIEEFIKLYKESTVKTEHPNLY